MDWRIGLDVECARGIDPCSLRTWGQGWLDFESPGGLLYKATGWANLPMAGVDLYVEDHGFAGTAKELGDLLAGRLPEGFRVTTDTAKSAHRRLTHRHPTTASRTTYPA